MSFEAITVLNLAGEPIPAMVKKKLRNGGREIRNLYGPSEDTTYSTCLRVDQDERDSIGKPISNTCVYILNEQNGLLPLGEVGEICISGSGLARGYLNNEALTKEKFVSNPFKHGERIYKTGDFGKWLTDGNLEFIGRKDEQIKIRGYRVELREIDHALEDILGVDKAISTVSINDVGDKELVSYFVSNEVLNGTDLRRILSKTLPGYMLPAYIVQLEKFPLTPNGKIDKESLPKLDKKQNLSVNEYVAPSNDLEERLVDIWKEILQQELIGVNDDFFLLRGHSLKAVRLNNEYYRAFSISLTLEELFRNKTVREHADLIQNKKRKTFASISKVPDQANYPISDAQKRLWILSRMEEASVAYNMPGKLDLQGPQNLELLQKSFESLMGRHEILRTVFIENGSGEIRQQVLEIEEIGFKIVHQNVENVEDQDNVIQEMIAEDVYKVFDLEKGPLFRAILFRRHEDSYTLYFNMHHIISDGWSIGVMSQEIFEFYNALRENRKVDLQPLSIQYRDYSNWQLEQRQDGVFSTSKKYWLEQLSGGLPQINLPSDRQRPNLKSYNGESLTTFLSRETTGRLKAYAQKNNGSLFIGLLASFKALLYRYTGQRDLIIGTAVAGRGHVELENQIGFYVNTLAIRSQVNPEESFDRFFQLVKETTLKSYDHQMYPFDILVEELNVQRDKSRSPVFDIMLILQNNGENKSEIQLTGTGVDEIKVQKEVKAKFDITITLEEVGDYLSMEFNYNTDVYEREMVERLIRHYKQLLSVIINNPKEKLNRVSYLSAEEQHQLLIDFSSSEVNSQTEETLIELFERQVSETPEKIAIIYGQEQLSYQELNSKANRIAIHLRNEYRIQPNDIVGIQLNRGADYVVALLAVLKSSGCCAPLNPDFPEERLIELQAECKLVINSDFLASFEGLNSDSTTPNLEKINDRQDLSYILFTSGSTGGSKGCMLEDRGVVNHLISKIRLLNLNSESMIIHASKMYFVGGIWQLWAPLIVGGKVFIPEIHEIQDISVLIEFSKKYNSKVLEVIPSQIANLFAINENVDFQGIEQLILTGEQLKADLIHKVFESNKQVEIINTYGQTECSDVTTMYRISKEDNWNHKFVGTPIQNISIYILDEAGLPCPVGVIGEICTAGVGVSRGYLNNEKLTNERFISNPFKPNEKMFKTGDLGRWSSNGEIEFIGRKDYQVKIRGYRIELGEIEHALLNHENVNQAAVVAKINDHGENELVAYLTATTKQSTNDLIEYLKSYVPDYMIPAYFIQLKEFPLMSNGKIDRNALPDPRLLGIKSGVEYVPPSLPLEKELVKIWEAILERDQIGMKDDFFALGGHSLKAVRLINEYQKNLDVKLSIKDLFTRTRVSDHVELIQSINKTAFIQIEPVHIQSEYAVSDAQRRLWLLSQFEDGLLAYNMPGSAKLKGKYSLDLLQQAFNILIERHEILRTVFTKNESGDVVQIVKMPSEAQVEVDFRDFRGELNIQRTTRYISEDSYLSFDLEKGPLLRATLIQTNDDEYVLYFNMHHIIGDEWSLELMSKEVFNYLKTLGTGKETQFERLRINYKDYSNWQLAQVEGQEFKEHKAYWLEKLSGNLPLIDLPTNKRRPLVKTYNGASLKTHIDKTTLSKLKKYTQQNGGSDFMALLAVWNVLVFRYTDQNDVIVGTPVSGRDHADLEEQIGFYVGTLVLRNQINPLESFDAYYNSLTINTLKSYEHQAYPFDRLVDELDLKRDISRSPVFDVSITYHTASLNVEQFGQSVIGTDAIIDGGEVKSKNDIELHFKEEMDGLSFHLIYNTDVYGKSMLTQLMCHFKQLLNALFDRPTQPLSIVKFLSKHEEELLLNTFNNTNSAQPKNSTLVSLFEEQAIKKPNDVALVFEGRKFTYTEINKLSNQLANCLNETYAFEKDDRVGIQLGRSEWMIIAILGVLKTGAAYVPIDAEYPLTRKEHMIKDSGMKLLITESAFMYDIDFWEGNLFALDVEFDVENYSIEKPLTSPTPESLAYVIYTSGSTGKPKGVMVENRTIVNTILSQLEVLQIDSHTKGLEFSSFSFDASIYETFIILIGGGQLFIANEMDRKNPELLGNYLIENEIDIATLSPSILGKMGVDNVKGLKTLITAGEVAHYEMATQFIKFGSYFNAYGPTEASICSSIYKLESPQIELSTIPIGKPIANTKVYILNDWGSPQPIGVVGEICVGGSGVARGYLNHDGLTSEKFVENPFIESDRLYKTGDLGRWLPDGNLEFVGRKDDQVKIRGYRVELGEIEQALLSIDAIKEIAVVVTKNEDGVNELVAYLTAESEQNVVDLRARLTKIVPHFMIPEVFVQLDELPLTTSGKIDRDALTSSDGIRLQTGEVYLAPRTEIEEKLASTWEDVLQHDQIGINDDFFALGGHSLKAMRLINDYQKDFGVKLSIQDIFGYPTITALAKLIENAKQEQFVGIKPVSKQDHYAVSDAQRRIWVLSQFGNGSVAYNMPGHIVLEQDADLNLFQQSFDMMIERHEILRTVFKLDDNGELRQWVLNPNELDFTICFEDYSDREEKEQIAESYIAKDALEPFNLEKGPLFRATLLQLGDERYIFYCNMHHIIGDGWSMEVLAKEVLDFYAAFKSNQSIDLEPLTVQYKDYAAWQLNQLKTQESQSKREYWLEQLSGELPLIDLPAETRRPKMKTHSGRAFLTCIDSETTTLLKDFSTRNGGSLFMGLLASWNVLMWRYTGQKDIIIGTPVAGREHSDLENQLGVYINILALRNRIDPTTSFNQFFNQVKEKALEGFQNQAYPFDRLVEELNIRRDSSRDAVFDVMLKVQNVGKFQEPIPENGMEEIIQLGDHPAKFDLDLTFQEVGDQLVLHVIFNTDVYSSELIERLIEHYKQLLVALLNSSGFRLKDIHYLSDNEKEELLVTNNNTLTPYPQNKTVIELFEEQVKNTPLSQALVCQEISLTYEELNASANRMAHYLSNNYNIQPDDLVGVQLKRDEWLIITLLGILKAGGAYVPLAIDYPKERISFIQKDTNYKVCIDASELEKFRVDELNLSARDSDSSAKPENLAYVIYTSGSTGTPKGVMVEHRALNSFINGFDLGMTNRIAGSTDLTFDISGLEIWGALCFGKTLVLLSNEELIDPYKFINAIEHNEVDVLQLTPSRLSQLYAVNSHLPKCLSLVIVGGEPLSEGLSEKLKSGVFKSVNAYGPTETTIWSTALKINQVEALSIGTPLPNEQIYILDENHQLQPTGVVGEICIGGDGLARGYLNQKKLTDEKFIKNPFFEEGRIYKTGDLGRWTSDGNIQFLGRGDDQVKIRGHRIELGEIESVLEELESIEQAIVLLEENGELEKKLVAYIKAQNKQNVSNLRNRLREYLPEYMLPDHYVQMDSFPLTQSGKINRRALTEIEGNKLAINETYRAAENELEKKLVAIWENVLNHEKIGITDNFFDLGGNSLKAISVIFSVQKELKFTIDIEKIFANPTIQNIALEIENARWLRDSKDKKEVQKFII
jgi:amino acid adenylation domain-containing protein